ncbi:L-tyrosine/L-tryptophan isonitrile synthase family protein [Streptomyces sp. NPDC086783]|uniref:L-tyrosine/L-tryptophan isonitrile synthase family protein n=1 Tax=Streptomyces sp. NPDC086783 TaxID=3365758 RepID=UPI00381AC52B
MTGIQQRPLHRAFWPDRQHSALEQAWQDLRPGESLTQPTAELFDPTAGMSYRTPTYRATVHADPSAPHLPPPDQWILKAFTTFVRGEFGDTPTCRPWKGYQPQHQRHAQAVPDIAERYLANCTATLHQVDQTTRAHRNPAETVERIYHLLCSAPWGNTANKKYLDPAAFRAWIEPLVAAQARLLFILPALPFKDQNPFRTASEPDRPDLAETTLLVRLHCLARAMTEIYPSGAEWLLLSDGHAYAGLFGIETAQARTYFDRIVSTRNFLNLQSTVSILDLSDVCSHANGKVPGLFESHRTHLIQRLAELAAAPQGPLWKAMQVLMRGMAWNYSTRKLVSVSDGDSMRQLWDAVHLPTDPQLPTSPLESRIRACACDAALGYAAFNLAVRWQDTLHTVFPQAIRATIHAKPGQVAVPSLGKVAPWNGVALVAGDQPGPHDIEIYPLNDIRCGADQLTAHHDQHGDISYFTRNDTTSTQSTTWSQTSAAKSHTYEENQHDG